MRENWQSRKGFIFAAAGAAIGLGNLWCNCYNYHRIGSRKEK